jgi:hypothetical protein
MISLILCVLCGVSDNLKKNDRKGRKGHKDELKTAKKKVYHTK